MIVCSRDLWPVLAVTIALAGCIDAPTKREAVDQQAGEAAPVAAQPEPDADILTLGAAKLMRAGHEDRAIVIGSDGVVTMAGIPFGTVSSDGRLSSPEGELMMAVQGDGTVVAGSGPTGMTIDESGGALNLPNLQVKIRFGADGVVETQASGPNARLLGTDAPELLSEGCTGPVTKTCALITLSYLTALGNPESAKQQDAP